MDHCYYCHLPCGPGGFCDESCKVNYDKDMEAWHDEIIADEAQMFYVASDDDEIIR